MRAGTARKHPKIPRLGYAFNLLQGDRVANHLDAVKAKSPAHLGCCAVMTGHGAQFANWCVNHREKIFDVAAKYCRVFVPHVMWRSAQSDRCGNMIFMVS